MANRIINGVAGGPLLEKVMTTNKEYNVTVSQILLDGKIIVDF